MILAGIRDGNSMEKIAYDVREANPTGYSDIKFALARVKDNRTKIYKLLDVPEDFKTTKKNKLLRGELGKLPLESPIFP